MAFVKKVVLFGPESTGKSTLAKNLASYYQTVHAPEYSRVYAETKGRTLEFKDVINIALGQYRYEYGYGKLSNNLLICDTDVLQTKIYSQSYFGDYPEAIEELITKPDLYLLLDIDVPWEYDSVRDNPKSRDKLFGVFENTLKKQNLPYKIISGLGDKRLKTAIKYIDELIKK